MTPKNGKEARRRAVVTGGAGFIGSHLARRLLQEGWEVLVVDNLSSGHEANVPAGARFLYADLTQEDSAALLPSDGADVVFHLASHVGQELSFERPVHDLKANALSTMILLKYCLDRKVGQFIFASTMNLYGTPEKLPVTEDSLLDPPSPYSVGKLASEHLCRIYETQGVPTTCLRLFNVYGPMQDMKNMKQGMVSIFMTFVARNAPVLVRGSKDRFRDFIHVDDVVDAFLRCVGPKARGKIYNVCTGRKTKVEELLGIMVKAFGRDPGKYPISYGEGTPRDQFGVYGDHSRITADLGWTPRIGLEDGIQKMADWARQLDASAFAEVGV